MKTEVVSAECDFFYSKKTVICELWMCEYVLNSGDVLHFHLFGRLKDFKHKQAKFLLGKKKQERKQ